MKLLFYIKQKHETELLHGRIVSIYYDKYKGMIGSPILTANLRTEKPFQHISQPRVARLAKVLGLLYKYQKGLTDYVHSGTTAANLLNHNFTVYALDTVYVSDVTYLNVRVNGTT